MSTDRDVERMAKLLYAAYCVAREDDAFCPKFTSYETITANWKRELRAMARAVIFDCTQSQRRKTRART